MISSAIIEYIRIYLNFRTNLSSVKLGKWSIEKDVFYDSSLDISFYLFLNLLKKLSVFEIKKVVCKELFQMDICEKQNISVIINSFLDFFYLSMQGIDNYYNFVHYKAISFFQLSINSPDFKKNDVFRLKYIKLLLSNSYFYDKVKLINFQNGTLIFDKQPLKDIFNKLLDKNNSDIFCEVVKYCLLLVDFMENGMKKEKVNELLDIVDDIYLENSHYKNFICSKSYKYRNIVGLINEMYQYPQEMKANFIKRMYLINFYFLSKKSDKYFIQYIKNTHILNKVIADFENCFFISK